MFGATVGLHTAGTKQSHESISLALAWVSPFRIWWVVRKTDHSADRLGAVWQQPRLVDGITRDRATQNVRLDEGLPLSLIYCSEATLWLTP